MLLCQSDYLCYSAILIICATVPIQIFVLLCQPNYLCYSASPDYLCHSLCKFDYLCYSASMNICATLSIQLSVLLRLLTLYLYSAVRIQKSSNRKVFSELVPSTSSAGKSSFVMDLYARFSCKNNKFLCQ